MSFKANGALFRNTEEKLRTRLGDRFDASKNYPMYDGVISVPADQAYALANYLMNATPNDRGNIPMRISGWRKEPQGGGDAYVSMSIEPDYKTQKAIEEAAADQPYGSTPAPAPAATQADVF
jgi:hypothetical protein